MAQRIRIGDMLVAAGALSEDDLEAALQKHRESGRRLGEELVSMGLVTEVQLTQMISNQLSIPWVSLYHVEFSMELLSRVPAELAEKYALIPVYMRSVRGAGDTLFVAMDDPTDEYAIDDVTLASGLPVKAMVAPPSEIRSAIRVYYFGETPKAPSAERRASRLPDAPVSAAAPAVEIPAEPAVPREAAPVTSEAEPAVEPPPAAAPASNASSIESATNAALAQGETPDRADAAPSATDDDASPSAAPAQAERAAPPAQKFVTLTLLDGTTVRLPAPGSKDAEEDAPAAPSTPPRLTAKDLVSALVARGQGADVDDILPDDRWEILFATLLDLLLKKGIVADWEFVEAWTKRQQ